MSSYSAQDRRSDADGGLEQLVYRSTSVSAVSSGIQMSDILAEARPRNLALGITGLLTAVNGVFVQVIEGSTASLDQLLPLIQSDPRHTDIRILERRPAKRRAFAEWDMVSPRLVSAEAAQVALLLADDIGTLDAFIPVFQHALKRQDRVLEGRGTPVPHMAFTASEDRDAESKSAGPDA